MKVSRIGLLLAAATFLEFFVGRSPYRAVIPVDWFLLATAAVSRSGDFVRAVLTGAAAGTLEDVSQPLIGLNAFAKAVISVAVSPLACRASAHLAAPTSVCASLARSTRAIWRRSTLDACSAATA